METIYIIASMFMDVFLGLLPYFLVGILSAAILEVFISPEIIQKITSQKKNNLLLMVLLAIFLPVANGGVIPLAKRLLKKGFPEYSVIFLIIAAPMINIISAVNSVLAVGWAGWVFQRVLPGMGLAIAAGVIFFIFYKEHRSLSTDETQEERLPVSARWKRFLINTSNELLDWIPYYILAALLAAIFRYTLPFSTWINIQSSSMVMQILLSFFYAFVLN
ncbi:MAG: permease, partial [Anaerolineae bacterium]|nr:permease [Anaerolineae bacterium]